MPHNTDFLFGFLETEFEVNSPNSLKALRHGASLTFCLSNITPDYAVCADAASQPDISFTVWVGEGSGNMFCQLDTISDYGSFLCPAGFQPKSWRKEPGAANQMTAEIKGQADAARSVCGGGMLVFAWSGIRSTAMEGVCRVRVKLTGFGAGCDAVIYYSLIKRPAPLRIDRFHAEPSYGVPGDTILLKWKVENARQGYIIPGGYDIFESEIQPSATRAVILRDGISRFYLNISNDGSGAFQALDVAMPPPRIDSFDINTASLKVEWEVYCTVERFLIVETQTKLERIPLEKNAHEYMLSVLPRKVALECRQGALTVTRSLAVELASAVGFFWREDYNYESHTILRVKWEIKAAVRIKLYVLETSSYAFNYTAKSGEWETLLLPDANAVLTLEYELAGGNITQLSL